CLLSLLSLIGVATSIILTGTVFCDEKNDKVTTQNATLYISTIKSDKNTYHGKHVMELVPNYWVDYNLRVDTDKSIFQETVSVEIKIIHNCNSQGPEKTVCYYLKDKSDYTVVRTHIQLSNNNPDPNTAMFNALPLPV
ncbi:hypothetical protein PMAYCL1PPCAC_22991, partial [Pristionchus mayeri]